MQTRFLTLSILFTLALSLNVHAQKAIDITSVSKESQADGRILYLDASGNPLSGHLRIVDKQKSEYRTYHFNKGFSDGKYTYHRGKMLTEEGEYSKGRKEGVFTEYFSDRTTVKRTRTYSKGKLDGKAKSYYTDGKVEKEIWYKDGLEHGKEKRWDYESGELLSEKNYIKGKQDGPQIENRYSNVSNYVIRCNYKMGVLDGEYLETYTDGVIRNKGQYSDGKKVGEWTGNRRYLDDKGKLKTEKLKTK